jgi:hypothetical protein
LPSYLAAGNRPRGPTEHGRAVDQEDALRLRLRACSQEGVDAALELVDWLGGVRFRKCVGFARRALTRRLCLLDGGAIKQE